MKNVECANANVKNSFLTVLLLLCSTLLSLLLLNFLYFVPAFMIIHAPFVCSSARFYLKMNQSRIIGMKSIEPRERKRTITTAICINAQYTAYRMVTATVIYITYIIDANE